MAHWAVELFGAELLSKDGKKATKDAIHGKKAVLVYFSAHWCQPCRGFTPVLAEAYKKYSGGDIEVIFASSDRDQGSFDEYFAEMPWMAIPFTDREQTGKMSQRFGVQGIPMLVVLNGDNGKLVMENGRGAVQSTKDLGKTLALWMGDDSAQPAASASPPVAADRKLVADRPMSAADRHKYRMERLRANAMLQVAYWTNDGTTDPCHRPWSGTYEIPITWGETTWSDVKQAVVEKIPATLPEDEVYVTQRKMNCASVDETTVVEPEHILKWGPYHLVKVVLDIEGLPNADSVRHTKVHLRQDHNVERLYILAGDATPTLPMAERLRRSDMTARRRRSVVPAQAEAAQPRQEALVSGLPDGWSQYYAPDGRAYYHNRATNVTQWDHPSAGRNALNSLREFAAQLRGRSAR